MKEKLMLALAERLKPFIVSGEVESFDMEFYLSPFCLVQYSGEVQGEWYVKHGCYLYPPEGELHNVLLFDTQLYVYDEVAERELTISVDETEMGRVIRDTFQ